MTNHQPIPPVVRFEPSLGRDARAGDWAELARGTFREAIDKLRAGELEAAAQLVEVTLLEADELRDVYDRWPDTLIAWMKTQGARPDDIDQQLQRLTGLIGQAAIDGIEAQWPAFQARVDEAATQCRAGNTEAANTIEAARAAWQTIHDQAVDRLSGMIDIGVRLLGENSLGALWDHLLSEWYDVHARRYSLDNQPWTESAHQLMIAIVDGFHAHLSGPDRQGDIDIIHEPDRTGFRFSPCGSGGRSVSSAITDGQPRAGTPFDFAVTTEPHDWAWNTVGVCSYCVHCCLLNEVMPIDRLGYPTRVIDPPVWPTEQSTAPCTWWIYHDPAHVPDSVYHRVGRDPDRRPRPICPPGAESREQP